MTLARSRLGTAHVVFFVMSAAAPLTVVAGSATTGFAVTGFVGVPVAYLAVAMVLALFAVGYVAMSRRVVNAGAFYSYVAHGLGRVPGVAAAFVAVLAYAAMQVSIYGAFGVVASQVVKELVGSAVTWWLCALAGWLLVALLGVRRITVSGHVLAVLLVAEIAVVLLFDLVLVTHPAGGQVSLAPLDPGQLLLPSAGALLVGGVAGFAGFEATTVFAEESRDPQRTVPRATYLALTTIGLLYGLSAWAMTVTTGPGHIVAEAKAHGTELYFVLAGRHLPTTLVDVGHLLFLTSLFAALLAFHNTVARYLFALGRERVLPAAWGRTSRRTGAPKHGSLVQSVLGLVVIIVFAAAGWDPIRHLFFWIGVGGGLGVLTLMTATSIAVIRFFATRAYQESLWRRAVAPAVAALVLAIVLAVTVGEFHTLLDVPPHSAARWAFPTAYTCVALIGAAWALVLRARRPDIYATVGLGADSVTAASGWFEPAVAKAGAR